MDIRHLKIFIEVAETGKMSAAATNLYVSQPTVSQTIREIEDNYNVLLFERLCRKLHITPEGTKLLKYAKRVVKQFDELEEKMLSINNIDTIKIGATITVGSCMISNIINRIKEKHEKIEPYVYINNTREVEKKLLNSELDIAIVEGEIKNPNLISIPEIEDFLVLACSKDHEFADRKMIELNELTDKPFVMREKGSGTRQLFENYMLENGFDVGTKWQTTCPEVMKSAIMKNGCLGVLSIRLIEDEVRSGEIKAIRHHSNEWDRNFSIVYHKDKMLDEVMEKVIDVIEEYRSIDLTSFAETGILINTCGILNEE